MDIWDPYHGVLYDRDARSVAGMGQPVRCGHCSRVYDLGKVTVVARYTDCSMWRCPGCSLLVDDRCDYFPMGTGRRDYVRLDEFGRPVNRRND